MLWRVTEYVRCENFPYDDIKHECVLIPDIKVEPGAVCIVTVSEAAPSNRKDYYYSDDGAFREVIRIARQGKSV